MSNEPTLVVLGASGDLAARLLFPALLSLEHRDRLEGLRDHRIRTPGVDDRSVPREPARRDRPGRRRVRRQVPRQVHRPHRVPRRRHLGRVAAGAARTCSTGPRSSTSRCRPACSPTRRRRSPKAGLADETQRLAPARDREAVRHRSRRRRSRSTRSCTRAGAKTRSSASTTSSARRRCRTSSCSGSRTGSSSRCCAPRTSTRSRSPSPRRSASKVVRATTTASARCRDMIQNHLVQMMTFATMEPPALWDAEMLRDHKVEVLKAVRAPDPETDAVRGQYTAGLVEGEPRIAYQAEPGVDPTSRTDTFAALRLHLDTWRWEGVPVLLRSGKRLGGEGARGRVPLPRAADAAVPAHAARARRAQLARVPDEPDRVHRARRAHEATRSRSRSARVGAARGVLRSRTTTRRRPTSSCCSRC